MASFSSFSSAAIKAGARLAERVRIMRVVLERNRDVVITKVKEMVSNYSFEQGECVTLEIAKGLATIFGVSPSEVTVEPLHNGWTSAQINH
ncbi:unnamed protein product [Cochlearia groenlandica]